MGELATAAEDMERYQRDGFQITSAATTERLTDLVHQLEKGRTFKDWSMPGANPAAEEGTARRGAEPAPPHP